MDDGQGAWKKHRAMQRLSCFSLCTLLLEKATLASHQETRALQEPQSWPPWQAVVLLLNSIKSALMSGSTEWELLFAELGE